MLVPADSYGWATQLSCVLPSLSLIWFHGEWAQGVNPAATFSCVFAKCFAGLAPELAHQAISKAPAKKQGELQERAAGSTARGVELLPVQVPAVASPSSADAGSASLMDELYSPGEGRELFDLINERRVTADERKSYRAMQQTEVIRYFHPTFFCLWGIQPFQDHNDSQEGHSLNSNIQYWWRGKIKKKIIHRNANRKGCFSSWLTEVVQRSLKATTLIQLFYLILFLGKQNRIFPPSAIKISFTFHMQSVKFSFRVSASGGSFVFRALGRSFLLHFFTSGSSFPPPCLFVTSLISSLQSVPVYQTDVGLL